jgi:hypothetical protein
MPEPLSITNALTSSMISMFVVERKIGWLKERQFRRIGEKERTRGVFLQIVNRQLVN